VPNLDDVSLTEIREAAREVRRKLDDLGLLAEFVAPRLWENRMTIDGAYTSNDPVHGPTPSNGPKRR
jgi:xylose isomerase